jgi:hypothetical protein
MASEFGQKPSSWILRNSLTSAADPEMRKLLGKYASSPMNEALFALDFDAAVHAIGVKEIEEIRNRERQAARGGYV